MKDTEYGMFLVCLQKYELNPIYLQGLKTGMYYLRTKPAANAIQFTVDKSKLKSTVGTGANNSTSGTTNGTMTGANSEGLQNMAAMVCSLENKDECLMCGS